MPQQEGNPMISSTLRLPPRFQWPASANKPLEVAHYHCIRAPQQASMPTLPSSVNAGAAKAPQSLHGDDIDAPRARPMSRIPGLPMWRNWLFSRDCTLDLPRAAAHHRVKLQPSRRHVKVPSLRPRFCITALVARLEGSLWMAREHVPMDEGAVKMAERARLDSTPKRPPRWLASVVNILDGWQVPSMFSRASPMPRRSGSPMLRDPQAHSDSQLPSTSPEVAQCYCIRGPQRHHRRRLNHTMPRKGFNELRNPTASSLNAAQEPQCRCHATTSMRMSLKSVNDFTSQHNTTGDGKLKWEAQCLRCFANASMQRAPGLAQYCDDPASPLDDPGTTFTRLDIRFRDLRSSMPRASMPMLRKSINVDATQAHQYLPDETINVPASSPTARRPGISKVHAHRYPHGIDFRRSKPQATKERGASDLGRQVAMSSVHGHKAARATRGRLSRYHGGALPVVLVLDFDLESQQSILDFDGFSLLILRGPYHQDKRLGQRIKDRRRPMMSLSRGDAMNFLREMQRLSRDIAMTFSGSVAQ
ncbi:hypothetical protein EV122DRAFT_251944 [Schizophyllum commune]